MAKLSRGITFGPSDFYSAAKFHALVDTAVAAADAFPGTPSLYDVVMGDLSATRAIHTASSPSSPSTNDLAVGADGELDRWDGAAWVDLAGNSMFLLNGSAITLVTGTPVVADADLATTCKLYGSAGTCPDPLGVSVIVTAPGATAQIQIHGIAPVRINSPITVAVGDFLSITSAGATALTKSSLVDNGVLAVVVQTDTASPLSGNAFAALMH